MKIAMRSLLSGLMLSVVLAGHALSEEMIHGKVVGVHDGDTLTMLDGQKTQFKIRLSEIDAPEIGQPYGDKAKKAMSDLAFGKQCDATVAGTDRYGRKIAAVTCDGKHVNREMVRAGAAWVYDAYPHSKSIELDESQAMNSKLGLWALQDDQRIEPWRWRKGERSPLKPEPKQEFTCGTKMFCSQMTSCEEARFYLNQCNKKTLDADSDGTPCESLCGQ